MWKSRTTDDCLTIVFATISTNAPSRDNIIGFILHQLKISPLKCALPHGIESSKNFQTLPHNHIRPPTLNISDSDVILFVHKYLELVVMRMSPGKWGILLNVPFLHYTLMSAQQFDINIDYFWFCSYSAMTLWKISEDSDQLICNGFVMNTHNWFVMDYIGMVKKYQGNMWGANNPYFTV